MTAADKPPELILESWEQERPKWCPHQDCIFKMRCQDAICGGHLPNPAPHDGDLNRYRFCLNGAADNGGVFDLQINHTDIFAFRKVLDAIDRPSRTPSPALTEGEREIMIGIVQELEMSGYVKRSRQLLTILARLSGSANADGTKGGGG